MKNFESYHVLGFILAYLSLHNNYVVSLPEMKASLFTYGLLSIAPFVGVLSTDVSSLEHVLLVLSYAFTEKAIGSLIVMEDKQKAVLSEYLHIVFVISILMLIYNRKLNVQLGYIFLLTFTMFSLSSRKVSLQYALKDYLIIHLLFFFTK